MRIIGATRTRGSLTSHVIFICFWIFIGKKGLKRKTVDPFSRKDWYDVKAPSIFEVKNVGKTLVNRSQGLKNANDSLKGRVMEFSLGDLNKEEDQAFRKIKLRVEDVKVSSLCLSRRSTESRLILVHHLGKELSHLFLRHGLHH